MRAAMPHRLLTETPADDEGGADDLDADTPMAPVSAFVDISAAALDGQAGWLLELQKIEQ